MKAKVKLDLDNYLIESNHRQKIYRFPNGYGASVINDGYGSDIGRLELAVMHLGMPTYDTPITDDVMGCLTVKEVEKILQRIYNLKPRRKRNEGKSKGKEGYTS